VFLWEHFYYKCVHTEIYEVACFQWTTGGAVMKICDGVASGRDSRRDAGATLTALLCQGESCDEQDAERYRMG
jgi:hypothetical protein